MPSEIKNTCKLFADDAKIFCNPLKTLLQHDINKYHNGQRNGSCHLTSRSARFYMLAIITHLSHILWKVENWNKRHLKRSRSNNGQGIKIPQADICCR